MTKDEWCKMWESIKKIEHIAGQHTLEFQRMTRILREVKFIKQKIQSEIGQME